MSRFRTAGAFIPVRTCLSTGARLCPGGRSLAWFRGHAGKKPRGAAPTGGPEAGDRRAGGRVLLVLTAPLVLVVAVLVAAGLGRPVLFRQPRVGRHGRRVRAGQVPHHAPAGSAAGTGARRGPADAAGALPALHQPRRAADAVERAARRHEPGRPPAACSPSTCRATPPPQARRHEVRPGVTGLAQVRGRNSLGWEEKLDLDVWYVDHRSLRLDLSILAATVRTVLRREGISAAGSATAPEFLGTPPPAPAAAGTGRHPHRPRRRWPMSGTIHLSPPDVGPLEESYVVAALRSGWVAPVGPDLDAFEREVADAGRHARRAVAVELRHGRAAPGAARRGRRARRRRHRADADVRGHRERGRATPAPGRSSSTATRTTGNLDVGPRGRAAPARSSRPGQRVGAVVPVDLFGSCADHTALAPVCAAAGVPVVEDAAEALGATHHGRPAGSFGQVGVLSFNGNKIITTSGGGMLVSDDAAAAGPGPVPVHPGPRAGAALRAPRDRATTTGSATCSPRWAAAQLRPAGRDDRPAPAPARPVRQARSPRSRVSACSARRTPAPTAG